MRIRIIFSFILAVLLVLISCGQVNLPEGIEVPLSKVEKLPSIEKILAGKPAITTSLKDALTEVAFLDDFEPVRNGPLMELPRLPNGAFALVPGAYQAGLQSYCLHAGTYVPSKGDGYLLAPLKGPRAEYIKKILMNSNKHREIPQPTIQCLIWAILARAKFEDLSPELLKAARKLLSPQELLFLNRNALDIIPEQLKEKAFVNLPPQLRTIMEAENNLRQMLTSSYASYAELEMVAVLTGLAPKGKDSREVPAGRWSFSPEGFFIRYFPDGYPQTHVQIYVPENFDVKQDSQGRIVLVADNIGNRLEIKYDDGVKHFVLPWDDKIKAYLTKEIKLVKVNTYNPRKKQLALFQERHWIFTGLPILNNEEKATQLTRHYLREFQKKINQAATWKTYLDYNSVVYEYKQAIKAKKSLAYLAKNLKVGEITPEKRKLLANLAHLDASIAFLIGGISPEKRDWLEEHQFLPKKAWSSLMKEIFGKVGKEATFASAVAWGSGSTQHKGAIAGPPDLFASLGPGLHGPRIAPGLNGNRNGGGGYLPSFNPSGSTAVPGNTSRQRLATSPRPLPRFVPRKRPRRINLDDLYRKKPKKLPKFDPNPKPEPEDKPKEQTEKARKAIDWIGNGTLGVDVISSPKDALGGQIGFGIPNYLFGKILDFNLSKAEEISRALGGDPPRSDYQQIARPEKITFERIKPSRDVSPARAAALNELMAISLDLLAYLRAAQISYDRFGGAVADQAFSWADRQSHAYVYYKRKAGLAMLEVADALDRVRQVLKQEGVRDIIVTPQSFKAYQQRIRTRGFDAQEQKAARLLGLTQAELENLRRKRLRMDPLRASVSLFKLGKQLSSALRTLGEHWASLSPNCTI